MFKLFPTTLKLQHSSVLRGSVDSIPRVVSKVTVAISASNLD